MGCPRKPLTAALLVSFIVTVVVPAQASAATSSARRYTRRSAPIVVRAPAVTAAGHPATIRGTVSHVSGAGRVTLERKPGPRSRWLSLATAPIRHHRFVFRIHTPNATAALYLRVVARGSRGHTVASRPFDLAITRTQLLKPSAVVSAPPPGQSGSLVYGGRTPPATGGFLAIGIGRATPDGLLVQVVHVRRFRHGRWWLYVRPASLFQAIPSGEISIGQPTSDIAQAVLGGGPRANLRPHLDLSCSAGASAEAEGSASLSLKPSLHLSWGWDWTHVVVRSASFSITATGSVGASASLTGSGSCSLKQQLFEHDFTPIRFFIGWFPVWIVPELLTTLTADADASASITTSVSASVSATGGLEYRSGHISPIDRLTTGLTFQPPTPRGQGSIGARLIPAGRLLVYGLAGPEFDLSGGPQFDIDTASSSLWRLHVPIDLSAQLVVPHTSFHLGPLHIYHHDFLLAQGSSGASPSVAGTGAGGSTNPVTIVNPGDQTGNVGAPVSLQIQAHDADGGALSYSATGLPPGLTIDQATGLISGTPTTLGSSTVTVTATSATGSASETTFTWTISASPTGSCEDSSSVFVLTTGSNVVAYVPKGNWGSTNTGISVVNVEGSSITPTLISTPNVVNSAASDPFTGQTVAVANNTDVYLLNGTTLASTLTSGGSGTIGFSGGSVTDAGIAMDSIHDRAESALSVGGTPGFQYLDLSNDSLGAPIASPSGEVSEDPLIDPVRNLLLSADENGNFEIANLSDPAQPAFYENATGAGNLDSTGEDCSTGIVVAPVEFGDPSEVFIADLSQASFTPGSPAGTWSAPSQVQTLSESDLQSGASAVAIAQGTHTGVLAGEFEGNQITAFTLPATSGIGTPAITDWVTCGIGSTPDGNAWSEGDDPHTMTAYQSPTGGDAIGLFGNEGASWLARVDLTQLLNPSIVPRDAGGHACASGEIPPALEQFIAVP